jgi:tetratricopeptide (TPR) repeat protein
MKWNMVRIEWMSFLLMFGAVYGSEKTETVSAAEKACRLRMAGNSNSAKEMLLEHLKNHPDDAVAQFEYSRTLFYLMDFETAEAHAGLAVQQDMDNPRYHYWQGLCETYLFIDKAHHKNELDLSILKRSINEFQKTIELKPDYHQARYLLVNLLNNNPPDQGGNPQKAHGTPDGDGSGLWTAGDDGRAG